MNGVVEDSWQLHVIEGTGVLVVAEEVSRVRGMDGTGQQRENTEVRGCPGRKSGRVGLDAAPELATDTGSCRCQEEAQREYPNPTEPHGRVRRTDDVSSNIAYT